MNPLHGVAFAASFALYFILMTCRPRLCAALGLVSFLWCAVDAFLRGDGRTAVLAVLLCAIYTVFPLLVAHLTVPGARKA